jgi:cyclopropane fatty-acyl-phospholipid synthase-like methyltransferase
MEIENTTQKWYNDFSEIMLQRKLNLRHYSIFKDLKKVGLKPYHRVLEIGCGIGQITRLLYEYCGRYRIVATDICDECIKEARKYIKYPADVTFIVTDMIDFDYLMDFDFIVLADVLEHIPVEQHDNLFGCISNLMRDRDSRVYIHIPHPKALDYIRRNNPHDLQIIDQSLDPGKLINTAQDNGLELVSFESYSLFDKHHDYIKIVFKKDNSIVLHPISKLDIIIKKFKTRIKLLFNCK